MKAFQIKVNGKYLDYRIGHNIDLDEFSNFLKNKGYQIEKLWLEKRHAVGIIRIDGNKLFIKLATSPGITASTINEFNWNEKFNTLNSRTDSDFWVPQNFYSGTFKNNFYLVTDYFDEKKLIELPNPGNDNQDFIKSIDRIISFSQLIESLKIKDLEPDEQFLNLDHNERFLIKARMWHEAIPNDVKKQYRVNELFKIVENSYKDLSKKPRHGDFTPWHMFKLADNKLLLFDGEHAISNGIEYYDISYLIQRIYSVLEEKEITEEILLKLKKRNYNVEKLRTVLASRAIGGFLDRSFHEKPNYKMDLEFKDFVLKL
jgi:hypothetical protein